MENFKAFIDINKPDERTILLSRPESAESSLKNLYISLESIVLIDTVPCDIKSQFNVIKNLAIYTWHSYSLAPVVQLKTYILIEQALKMRFKKQKWPLPKLIKKAINFGYIKDIGFYHLNEKDPNSIEYVTSMIDVLPKLRNSAAHGSNSLTPNSVGHIQICADWINQLFYEYL